MQFVEDFILNRRNGIIVFIREDKVYGGVQGIAHLDKGREGDFDTVIFNVADMRGVAADHFCKVILCQAGFLPHFFNSYPQLCIVDFLLHPITSICPQK